MSKNVYLDIFVRALTESAPGRADPSQKVWVVGTGITAAVTGNIAEATWVGLIRVMINAIAAKQGGVPANSLFKPVVDNGVDKWYPDGNDLWYAVDWITERMGGPENTRRWISNRMRLLEAQVTEPDIIRTLAAFGWPIATTNYDNILADRLPASYCLINSQTEADIRAWLSPSVAAKPILHLHGHRTQLEGVLFTRDDYRIYTGEAAFRRNMDVLFQAQPVFIGCRDTLLDPNIGAALKERFAAAPVFESQPLVLLRKGETLSPDLAVQEIFYGDQHKDLLPFLHEALQVLRGAAYPSVAGVPLARSEDIAQAPVAASPPPSDDWLNAFFKAVAHDSRLLRLPDFRTADGEMPLTLDDVYLALSLDGRTERERLEESRALLAHQGEHIAPVHQLAQNPFMRDGAMQQDATANLADVLQNQCAVILGHPGSGKTTLTYWLARQCAIARLADRSKLIVEALRVDPDAAAGQDPKHIGPAWLPILIPVADYARERLEMGVDSRRRLLHYAVLSIVRRLAADATVTTFEEVLRRIEEEAASGHLLIMVDGLDEDIRYEERRSVVDEIEWLRAWLLTQPAEGNRLLVTTRVAGYKYAPLPSNIPHYNVNKLTQAGKERLLGNLFVSAVVAQNGTPDTVRRLEMLKDGLLQRLRGQASSDLTDLIETPVLASALFAYYVGCDGLLPEDRHTLYRGLIDLFMRREAKRLHPEDLDTAAKALRTIFQDLAFTAFSNPASNLITEGDLAKKLAELADQHAILNTPALGAAFGPLVPKMAGGFAFIHRTFQEYLCAEFLTRPSQAFAQLVELAGTPSWSEPARLGFMIWLSDGIGAAEKTADLATLQAASSLGTAFRPLALMLAAATETAGLDDGWFTDLVETTVAALADALPNWTEPPADLVSMVKHMMAKPAGLAAVEKGLVAAVDAMAWKPADYGSIRRAAVAARLAVAADLFTPALIKALRAAWPADSEALHWPISGALLRAVTPDVGTAAADLGFEGRAGRSEDYDAAAGYLAHHPAWLDKALRTPGWARLLTALFGGQRDYELSRYSRLYGTIAGFLQLPDRLRQELMLGLPVEWLTHALQKRNDDNPDLIYELAVYLDTDGGQKLHASKIPPRFRPASCLFPVPDWAELQEALDGPAAKASLVSPVLHVVVDPEARPVLSEAQATRARNLQFRIADSAFRSLRTLTTSDVEAIMRRLPPAYQALAVDSLAIAGATLGEVGAIEAFFRLADASKSPGEVESSSASVSLSDDARAVIRREHLSNFVGAFQDDRRYNAAVWLDTAGLRGMSLAGLCRAHAQTALPRSDLPHLPPAYFSRDATALVLDDLTAVERFPRTLEFFAGEAASELTRIAPEALPEIAAVLGHWPWFRDEGSVTVLDFDPHGDPARLDRLIAEAPPLWQLRARIRRLGRLTGEARRQEEADIAGQLDTLPPGLTAAQCIELLAERARYLATADLVSRALAVEGVDLEDGVCLRLRLLPLIDDAETRSSVLAELVSMTREVAEEDSRMVLLHALHGALRVRDELGEELDYLLQSITDPVKRHYAARRPGAVLAALADGVMSGEPVFGGETLAPLIVHSRLNDLLDPRRSSYDAEADPLGALAKTLATGSERNIAVAVAVATIACPRGLLPLCRAGLFRFHGTPLHDQLMALVIAASEGFGPETVDGIVSALSCDYDEVRARARAVLLPASGSQDDKLSAAGLGLETLLALAKKRSEMLAQATRAQIGWRLEDTVLDSEVLAESLCALGDGDDERAAVAQNLLTYFASMTPDVRERLASHAATCSPGLRRALWQLFAAATRDGPAPPATLFASGLTCAPDSLIVLIEPGELIGVLLESASPVETMGRVAERHGRPLSRLFFSHNDDALALVEAFGRSRFSRNSAEEEKHKAVVDAAKLLLEVQDGPMRAATLLAYLLAINPHDPAYSGTFVRSDLTVLLAAAAELQPAVIAPILETPELRPWLAKIATGANSFPARRAAFLLLGHLFEGSGVSPTHDESMALLDSAADVSTVIYAAQAAAGRIHVSGLHGLAMFCRALSDDSAARSCVAGRMLISIARNKEIGQEARADVMRDIDAFIRSPLADRQVYFGALNATSPTAPTVREYLLQELSASGGGVARGVDK